MAARSLCLLFAVACVATDAAKTEAQREPLGPSDILFATGSLIYDHASDAYTKLDAKANELGIHKMAKEHYSNIVGDDIVGSTCKKVGCDAKDINGKLNQAQGVVQQAKAQAYEYGAKARDQLNGLSHTVMDKFEAFLPHYKGSIRRTFLDVVLVTLYFAFVAWIVIKISLFGLRKSLSIFCFFFCCGCCRSRGGADAKKGKNKKGGADAKATPKQQAAKAKAGGKK